MACKVFGVALRFSHVFSLSRRSVCSGNIRRIGVLHLPGIYGTIPSRDCTAQLCTHMMHMRSAQVRHLMSIWPYGSIIVSVILLTCIQTVTEPRVLLQALGLSEGEITSVGASLQFASLAGRIGGLWEHTLAKCICTSVPCCCGRKKTL